MTTARNLQQKFDKFKALPFPENSANDELSDIFAELVELDGHIAGLVSSFLRGKPVRKELVYIDQELNQRLAAFKPNTPEERETLLSYHAYKFHLDELVHILQDSLR